ncbi:MAG: glycosyltransferase family 4 protein [Candidatus Methylumidiphilus sp.]
MSRPLRILLFSTLYPSSARPGHGVFVETRLRHLLSSGEVEARVVAPVPWFPLTHPRFGEWAQIAKTPARETWHGLAVKHPRYPLPPKIGMNPAPFLLAAFALPTIRRLRREFDFDLIDAHYYYPDGVAAALLARSLDVPFVVTARGTDLNLIPQYPLPRRLIRWAAGQAAGSIGVCRALTDSLRDLGADPAKLHVMRNGVDLRLFHPSDPSAARAELGLAEGRWLVSVGWLVERKGHDIAIKALPLLPDDVRLAVIGEGALRTELEKLAAGLGLQDRVRFVGAIPQGTLRLWYAAADALVLCSSREGWANVLLESMACGTPVVATSIWGTPEVVQNRTAGRLMAERTPTALADAVADLFADYPPRTDVRAYAEQFGWEETTQAQLALFRRVLAYHRQSSCF